MAAIPFDFDRLPSAGTARPAVKIAAAPIGDNEPFALVLQKQTTPAEGRSPTAPAATSTADTRTPDRSSSPTKTSVAPSPSNAQPAGQPSNAAVSEPPSDETVAASSSEDALSIDEPQDEDGNELAAEIAASQGVAVRNEVVDEEPVVITDEFVKEVAAETSDEEGESNPGADATAAVDAPAELVATQGDAAESSANEVALASQAPATLDSTTSTEATGKGAALTATDTDAVTHEAAATNVVATDVVAVDVASAAVPAVDGGSEVNEDANRHEEPRSKTAVAETVHATHGAEKRTRNEVAGETKAVSAKASARGERSVKPEANAVDASTIDTSEKVEPRDGKAKLASDKKSRLANVEKVAPDASPPINEKSNDASAPTAAPDNAALAVSAASDALKARPETTDAAAANPNVPLAAAGPGAIRQAPTALRGHERGEPGAPLTRAEHARFLQRVTKAFQAAQDNDGEIRLRLSPPELGALRLEVKVTEGALSARLEAETQHARSLLLDNLPQLRERLADQGIRIERFEVDLSDKRNMGQTPDTPSRDQQQGEAQTARQLRTDSGNEPANSAEATARRPLRSDGGLNVIV